MDENSPQLDDREREEGTTKKERRTNLEQTSKAMTKNEPRWLDDAEDSIFERRLKEWKVQKRLLII